MIDNVIEIMDRIINNPSVITANRLSIINGKEDFTEFGSVIKDNETLLLDRYACSDNTDSAIIAKCIIQIILAEIYYQENDCYNALIMVNSALAFLEAERNESIWMVGRFFQMCVMIVTGQVSAIYPLVDGMETRIYKTNNKGLIDNYEALRAWIALYDDAKDTINRWMTKQAPNEYGEIKLEDSFAYMIKARIYHMQRKYMANYTLLQSLIPVLEANERQMELCEAYMLLALTFYADGHRNEAFDAFEKSLGIASERNYMRLLVDEGEDMYRLSRSYKREHPNKDIFLNNVINASKEMALMYPQYLKNKDDSPSLTKKEMEVLLLLADGRNNMEIAEFLDNTLNTIKHHLKNIYAKLEVSSREDAVEVAKREQLI